MIKATNVEDLPIHAKGNVGGSLKTVVLAFGVLLALQLVRLFLVRTDVVGDLLHDDRTIFFGILLSITLIFGYFSRHPSTLDITSGGIQVTDKKAKYFYAWQDIVNVKLVKTGVQLDVRGQTPEQNRYNVLSSRFGVAPARLLEVIAQRITDRDYNSVAAANVQPGVHPRLSGRSITPGENARNLAFEAMKRFVFLYASICFGLISWLVVLQLSDFQKSTAIRQHAVRTNAAVTRYDESCGRSGCSVSVGYAFWAPSQVNTKIEYHGIEYLAGGEYHRNLNYLYAITYHSIPILYDAENPARSELNFHDFAFRKDPKKIMVSMIVGIGGMMLLVSSLIGGVCIVPIWLAFQKLPRSTVNDSPF